jgi:opacity protein-like surface antigen
MMSVIISKSLLDIRRAALAISVIVLTMCTAATLPAVAQDNTPPPSPGDNVRYGYVIHQSVDFGGHIVTQSGSGAMYDTLVNIQSGPRLLDSSFQMVAVNPAHALLFDRLSSNSFGYGGDPLNGTFMNASKGRIYNFQGSFRRDRQYFDYNLLANPLIPPTSTPFVPALDTPHLYNTVRRMTDVNITLAPLSKVSPRFGYSQNIHQGPSGSTIHVSADGLLLQNWRLSTDVWNAGIDWKPLARTSVSFDEFITHYKGNTSWQLIGLNYKLSNGTPVSLGVNLSSVWNAPCAAPFAANGTVNPTCNSFLAYTRSAPTRALLPSEQFRFQSASIPHVTMNGRFLYMGTTSNLTNYNEFFNGLQSGRTRQSVMTGSASARRINVNADYGITWEIVPKFGVSDTFDFWYFRQPATNTFTTTTYAGTSTLLPPGAATTTTASGYEALNQKTKINTFLAIWDLAPRARVSAGYRYSSRIITEAADGDFIPIHAHTALFGLVLRPTTQLRVNFNAEAMSADNAFTRISPRKLQHYRLRTTYDPRPWLTLTGTINILASSDNVQTVNHFAHNQDFSFGAVVHRSERWGIDLNYAYDSVYGRTDQCYASSAPTAIAQPSPTECQQVGLPWQSNGFYNQPTQYGSIGFMLNPVKKLHAAAGYRMSAVNGSAPPINIRQVPGSLQSQYQTPYGRIAYDLTPNWTWKGDYNYYSYGEGSPIGPTLPRSFHGNVITLAIRYSY